MDHEIFDNLTPCWATDGGRDFKSVAMAAWTQFIRTEAPSARIPIQTTLGSGDNCHQKAVKTKSVLLEREKVTN